jgi:hypothetical protein
MVQEKWVMRYRLFHSLQVDLQRQLQLARTTRARYSTTLKWCVGATMRMANLVRETWTTLAIELVQPLRQHQRLIWERVALQ